jgi:transposase
VFSAVCPETGDAAGLIAPHVNTEVMNAFLEQFAKELPPDVHAAMVLDRAGWHVAAALRVPQNVTLILLPPKSPELNPAENLWHYLRSHYWSNRLYPTWEDLKQAAVAAWRAVCLVPELIKSVCADTALRAWTCFFEGHISHENCWRCREKHKWTWHGLSVSISAAVP